MNRDIQAAAAARQFQIAGEFAGAVPYGSGHINDTWCATFRHGDVPVKFILQRINTTIFRNPVALMENIQRVTSHLEAKLTGEADGARRVLALLPALDGRAWHEDAEGEYWRAYRFLDKARTYDVVESPRQACQAARAFGRFQQLLSDLPAPRLHDTIPDFHNTPGRFACFERALAADAANRAGNAREEIEFALARKAMTGTLLEADLPERVTHNDTKLNNVLLDDETGEGICVIDLDTVMPGLSLYDFGDMVRTTTSAAMEDERDLAKVTMRFPMFEAVVRGYLSTAGAFLTQAETQHLALAAKLITFEQGIRFLTDYLTGDTYYKVHRDGQNLDRCRTQFKLVESIEEQEGRMNFLIGELVSGRAVQSAPA